MWRRGLPTSQGCLNRETAPSLSFYKNVKLGDLNQFSCWNQFLALLDSSDRSRLPQLPGVRNQTTTSLGWTHVDAKGQQLRVASRLLR